MKGFSLRKIKRFWNVLNQEKVDSFWSKFDQEIYDYENRDLNYDKWFCKKDF